jgi:ABC-type Fe3+ transport system permease subunit
LPIPTALGFYGFERVSQYGLDDVLSWWLLPIFGFTLAGTCLNAIVYGLMTTEKWNAKFNPDADPLHAAGNTRWATIGAIVLSLMIGTAAMLSGLAYGFQRYFESTIEIID